MTCEHICGTYPRNHGKETKIRPGVKNMKIVAIVGMFAAIALNICIAQYHVSRGESPAFQIAVVGACICWLALAISQIGG